MLPGVQQSDLHMHMCTCLYNLISSFPLCSTVGPYWLSILRMTVCICPSPNLLLSTWNMPSASWNVLRFHSLSTKTSSISVITIFILDSYWNSFIYVGLNVTDHFKVTFSGSIVALHAVLVSAVSRVTQLSIYLLF